LTPLTHFKALLKKVPVRIFDTMSEWHLGGFDFSADLSNFPPNASSLASSSTRWRVPLDHSSL
jgi:hypothetical protein